MGEYKNRNDEKKRISLPSKFRKEIGRKVVITHGLDSCLFLYPMKEWGNISLQLSKLGMVQADKRGFSRFMLAGAVEVEVDAIGRILIPDFLKEFAGLRTKVVFTGVHNRIEIWDDSKWKEYKKKIEKQADGMAEKLGEIGML